jgi:hypothetical protein
MEARRPTGRQLKIMLAELLLSEPFGLALERLQHFDARQAVSPLFGFFCSRDRRLRWRAVTAMGTLVARLAAENMEAARVVMRRFMWNLNEESGGIGWGCPEAMGECMARSGRLADEYGCILASYLHPERNYIEHPALQEGVLWGVGRLAQARPAALAECAELLIPFLEAPAAALRGHAAWAAGCLGDPCLARRLEELVSDRSEFEFYEEGRLERLSVGTVAERALTMVSGIR